MQEHLADGARPSARYSAACSGHFITRASYITKAGRSRHYGCGRHSRPGSTVCPNRSCPPQAAIERALLEVLLSAVLSPANQARLLTVVNSRLCAQVAEARPRITELRKALTKVEREISNYTRAIGRGDFLSLEEALGAAERRRATLKAELTNLEGSQPTAVMQLPPAALERHLQGMMEKLRSGVNGQVREAIQQSVARILVGADGSLTIEAKPDGLLGVEGIHARSGGEGEQGIIQQTLSSSSGRRWRVTSAL